MNQPLKKVIRCQRPETVAADQKGIDMASIPQSYTLKVHGEEFIASFSTALLQLPEKPGDGGFRLTAICVLRFVRHNTHYTGAAICNPHDLFDQETGNQIAFKRAVHAWQEGYGFVAMSTVNQHDFRHALWEARLEAAALEQDKLRAESTTTV